MFVGPTPAGDEANYVRLAHNLADGSYRDPTTPDIWFGPGLPLLLAPLALFDAPLEAMRFLGPLLLFATVVLFYKLLLLRLGSRTALLGAAALGLYWPLYALLPTLHSEIPALFFVALFMYSFSRQLRDGGFPLFVLASASLASLALTRVVFGWIVLGGLVIWLGVSLTRSHRIAVRLAGIHALALALCIPWLAYTYWASEKPFYWSSSGGLSLYWMASPHEGDLGDWHSPADVFGDPRLAPHRPEFAKLATLSEIESDTVLRKDAINLIQAHPNQYAENVVANLSRIWFNVPYSGTVQGIGSLFYILPNAILFAGMLGIVPVLWLRRHHWPPEVAPFAVLFLLALGAQALLAAYSRMLIPLLPLVLWLIVSSVALHVRIVGKGSVDT